MSEKSLFAKFSSGCLSFPGSLVDFEILNWNAHPSFKGVALKHLVTAKESGGRFSYHLVKIEPGCEIGLHVHETQLESHEVIEGQGTALNNGEEVVYSPGIISIFEPNTSHKVSAGADGLRLFAKFFPPLC